MKHTSILLVLAALLVFSCLNNQNSVAGNRQTKKPNIILIMSDDMGFSDIGCYGGEIQTPNLDQLAAEGIRFTQFYNTARCCPTRASLMTGLYPHQAGIGHMTNPSENPTEHDVGLPGYRGFMNKNSVTLAEVLKSAGYATLMTGKWHLGMQSKDQWPLQRGFDRYYGILDGATNYFKPKYPRGITLNNDAISINDPEYYTTDAFTDNAINFIKESVRKDANKPFFLYLAYNAPHWPLQAPKADIDKYRERYKKGWQDLRKERYQRMIDMGIISSNWQLSDQDSRDWDSLPPTKKEEMELRRAIYAAQVDHMDQEIGKLVDFLKKKNMIDNTVIMFIDDNGACAEGGELGKGPVDELETKKGYMLSYGRAWANASNTPFRRYKHWIHEGGISSPCIVHWPAGIPKDKNGSLVKQYGFLPDIMATFVDLSGAQYPSEFNGNKIQPMEGKSMVPLFKGHNETIHPDPIFWEHEGNKAVRLGKYKLVMAWDGKNSDNWELYDMETDRTEMNDLAKNMPEKVAEMDKMYQEWASNNHVLPWDEIRKLYQQKKK